MGNLFGHENLRVYRVAVEFVTLADGLLLAVEREIAACDHLSRAMESIPVHIAHANNSWSAKERITYLGHANGSVLECAACLDVLVARGLHPRARITPAKRLLRDVCNMLVAMQQAASDRVKEGNDAPYEAENAVFFSHERLDVYQTALAFVSWADGACRSMQARRDLANRLDRDSTGIVLNIAEGNGRFTSDDHARFLGMAHSATVQCAATLDLTVARKLMQIADTTAGRELLARIDAMLAAMVRRFRGSRSDS